MSSIVYLLSVSSATVVLTLGHPENLEVQPVHHTQRRHLSLPGPVPLRAPVPIKESYFIKQTIGGHNTRQ